MKLSQAQLRAVRYYGGDVSGDDPFWGDPKAYVALNSLFYDGIGTETRRAAEGKRLNPAILADPVRLYEVCRNLLSAFRVADLSQDRTGFRVERYADYLEMKQAGGTLSFTSTAAGGFLKAYGDRIGITLMEFHIPKGMPCLPFAEVLQEDYLKSEEQEILLPPGLAVDFTEVPLSETDREIRDAEGSEPYLKCVAAVTGVLPARTSPETDWNDMTGIEAGMRVYVALNAGKQPEADDTAQYVRWKQAFRRAVLKNAY